MDVARDVINLILLDDYFVSVSSSATRMPLPINYLGTLVVYLTTYYRMSSTQSQNCVQVYKSFTDLAVKGQLETHRLKQIVLSGCLFPRSHRHQRVHNLIWPAITLYSTYLEP
jgi:hypothetical protein